MAVRSTRLFGPTQFVLSAVHQSLYVVPAGRTAIVRAIFIRRAGAGAAARMDLRVVPAVFGEDRAVATYDLAANDGAFQKENGPFILNPGDEFRVLDNGGVNATVNILGMGTLLFGAPT